MGKLSCFIQKHGAEFMSPFVSVCYFYFVFPLAGFQFPVELWCCFRLVIQANPLHYVYTENYTPVFCSLHCGFRSHRQTDAFVVIANFLWGVLRHCATAVLIESSQMEQLLICEF